jgi:uncharacterized glyoxalase superfamily protein PhnB
MAIVIENITALFQVYDMHKSVAFHRDPFGFEVVHKYEPDGHFYWAMLKHGEAVLMLNAKYEDENRPGRPVRIPGHNDLTLCFDCLDVDGAYTGLCGKGCSVTEPETTHYGMRQLTPSDPDGFQLCFQQRAK